MNIQNADARDLPLLDASVDVVVTSPPYFGLRSYGVDMREIGRKSLSVYITEMVDTAEELWRILKKDGLLWLNVGDTASGSGGAGGDWNSGTRGAAAKWRQGASGIPPMSWCNVPARLSIALQDAGWLLRSTIIWDKGAARPESLKHARRPGVAHETILLLAKDRHHRFYDDRLSERGSVWHFPPARGSKAKNHAAFPIELPQRCILASTELGETVLDPFAGGGTTLKAAEELGRIGLGFDLYAEIADSKKETLVPLIEAHG